MKEILKEATGKDFLSPEEEYLLITNKFQDIEKLITQGDKEAYPGLFALRNKEITVNINRQRKKRKTIKGYS